LEVDKETTITGAVYKDEHILTYGKWGRIAVALNQFLAVDNVEFTDPNTTEVKFNDHQGYIGLAPYSADLDHLETNFLW